MYIRQLYLFHTTWRRLWMSWVIIYTSGRSGKINGLKQSLKKIWIWPWVHCGTFHLWPLLCWIPSGVMSHQVAAERKRSSWEKSPRYLNLIGWTPAIHLKKTRSEWRPLKKPLFHLIFWCTVGLLQYSFWKKGNQFNLLILPVAV